MVHGIDIRPATPDDAPAIAELHVRSWQWAYRGQVPDEYLDGLPETIPRRTQFERTLLTDPANPIRTWVALRDDRIVGFIDAGPSRDGGAGPQTGEIPAIYLDPAVVRQGVGRALMTHAVDALRQRGFADATLWVLASNERARRFYEALGWRADGATKVESRPGFGLHEVRYRLRL